MWYEKSIEFKISCLQNVETHALVKDRELVAEFLRDKRDKGKDFEKFLERGPLADSVTRTTVIETILRSSQAFMVIIHCELFSYFPIYLHLFSLIFKVKYTQNPFVHYTGPINGHKMIRILELFQVSIQGSKELSDREYELKALRGLSSINEEQIKAKIKYFNNALENHKDYINAIYFSYLEMQLQEEEDDES